MRYVKRGLIYRLFGRVAEYAIGAPIEVTTVYGLDGNVIDKSLKPYKQDGKWFVQTPQGCPKCNTSSALIMREHNAQSPVKYSMACSRCMMNGPACITKNLARAAWATFIEHR